MTTVDAELFSPMNMARAKLTTGAWQDKAACRGDVRFTTRPIPSQLAVCAGCPVADICSDMGLFPVVDARKATFACGHPRTADNSVRNGWRKNGTRVTMCRECRSDYRASRRAA